MEFTVLLTPDMEDGGYVAECPSIPGCISEGDTVEEALHNIKDAIEGCLETLAANQQELPEEQPSIVATVDSSFFGAATAMACAKKHVAQQLL